MANPVTSIANPVLGNESLLFTVTGKQQLALERWPFDAGVSATDYKDNGLWNGPLALPSSLTSLMRRGIPTVYGFLRLPDSKPDDPLLIAQISPIVQPIRAGDAMKTKLKGIASAGDGDSNVFLYFLNQAAPGTKIRINECNLIGEADISLYKNPSPGPTSRLAAVYLPNEDNVRLIFFQQSADDEKDIQCLRTDQHDAVTIPQSSNAKDGSPLAACIYEGFVYLYFMTDAKELYRTSMALSTGKWTNPVDRKMKTMSSDTQLTATPAAKHVNVFYMENGTSEYNVHRDKYA